MRDERNKCVAKEEKRKGGADENESKNLTESCNTCRQVKVCTEQVKNKDMDLNNGFLKSYTYTPKELTLHE